MSNEQYITEGLVDLFIQQHGHMLELITQRIPKTKMIKEYEREYEFTRGDVTIEDGKIRVEYSRYIGCGDYDRHEEYLEASDLF